MDFPAPRKLGTARVLRYQGDTAADWTSSPVSGKLAFQGGVSALAIVEDEAGGGVSQRERLWQELEHQLAFEVPM